MNIHEYQAKEVLRGFGVATGKGIPAFSVDEAVKAAEDLGRSVFLPLGHDAAAAAALRAEGWRTVAALSAADDGAALGCSHVLDGGAVRLV